jgi:hypothetical protein
MEKQDATDLELSKGERNAYLHGVYAGSGIFAFTGILLQSIGKKPKEIFTIATVSGLFGFVAISHYSFILFRDRLLFKLKIDAFMKDSLD